MRANDFVVFLNHKAVECEAVKSLYDERYTLLRLTRQIGNNNNWHLFNRLPHTGKISILLGGDILFIGGYRKVQWLPFNLDWSSDPLDDPALEHILLDFALHESRVMPGPTPHQTNTPEVLNEWYQRVVIGTDSE